MENKNVVVDFTLGQMLGIGLTLVVLGIALSYGLEVMSDVREDIACPTSYQWNATDHRCCVSQATGMNCTNTSEYTAEGNASNYGMEGVMELPTKMPMIATIIIAALVIGILLRYFSFAR